MCVWFGILRLNSRHVCKRTGLKIGILGMVVSLLLIRVVYKVVIREEKCVGVRRVHEGLHEESAKVTLSLSAVLRNCGSWSWATFTSPAYMNSRMAVRCCNLYFITDSRTIVKCNDL